MTLRPRLSQLSAKSLPALFTFTPKMSTTRTQPPWTKPTAPEGVKLPPLKIYNSLTRNKELFVPLDPAGKKVTWYACGPTVYDVSHLGHARNYVSTDIIRRLLRDFFGFDVNFVMNITDIDDKIVLRGRQAFFWDRYKKEHPTVESEVVKTGVEAFWGYVCKNLPLVAQEVGLEGFVEAADKAYKAVKDGGALEGSGPPGDNEAKIKMHLRTTEKAAKALLEARGSQVENEAFYPSVEDVFLPYLDGLHFKSIDPYDHTIFTNLTKHYENLFFEDMDNLNVLRPTKITRVTEYGPEIVAFVEKIVEKGFAYPTADGSVYFDIAAFEKAGNPYARLEPWNRNDKDLQADGEGAIFAKQTASEKKGESDFALWKGSKAGEPAWKSPWGSGRPGWHIECSVMASETLGKQMDVHSGGIDLAFPHHDNELAQSEAYWSDTGCTHGSHEWVKYFLHMGHLSISGHKMSKSLKNFTSVASALSASEDGPPAFTSRGLRIIFLLGGWKDGVEITEGLVKEAKGWEEKLTNFFIKALDIQRITPNPSSEPSIAAESLKSIFTKGDSDVYDALCDSFNTPLALNIISQLITNVNSINPSNLDSKITIDIAHWLTKIVTIFGLNGSTSVADLKQIGWEGVEIPHSSRSTIYPLAALRDQVRALARSKDFGPEFLEKINELASTSAFQQRTADVDQYVKVSTQFASSVAAASENKDAKAKDILSLCDDLRNTQLWDLDIYLEDRDGLPALVRPLDSSLKAARADKERIAQETAARKEAQKKADAEKQKERDRKASIKPEDLFKTAEWEGCERDGDGIPVKDQEGKDVTKSKLKGLKKDWARQKKEHEEWLKRQGK